MANSQAPNLISGEKTVAAAGTAEALDGAPALWKSFTVIAKSSNTGQVYLGGSDVDSATNGGLDAGESLSFESRLGFDLSKTFIDVDTNGEGVDFYATS